jgi:hypothetical protein
MTEKKIVQLTTAEVSNVETRAANVQLSSFKIAVVGEARMYANGNQQCKIEIQVDKQIYNETTSRWDSKPLSSNEIQSIKIVSYSSDLNASLPRGWYYDIDKNEFDVGFLSSGFSARSVLSAEEPISYSSDMERSDLPRSEMSMPIDFRASFEIYNRYLRCSSSVAIQPEKLMAVIKLDNGQTYSTHSIAGESNITVIPVRAYRIAVNDLLNPRRVDALTYMIFMYDVDVYYWQLPNGLKIKREDFSGEGFSGVKIVFVSDKIHDKRLYKSAIIKKDVTSLSLKDIFSPVMNQDIPLEGNDRFIRALRTSSIFEKATGVYDNRVNYKVTDNFGCEHKFIFKSKDNYNLIEILDGQ